MPAPWKTEPRPPPQNGLDSSNEAAAAGSHMCARFFAGASGNLLLGCVNAESGCFRNHVPPTPLPPPLTLKTVDGGPRARGGVAHVL